jgi:hypothetical protein
MEPELTDKINITVSSFDISGRYFEFGDTFNGWIWDSYLLYRNFSDISFFTKSQVRLFVAYFYAMHGYNFENPYYKNYFKNFSSFVDSESRNYVVNPDFSEDSFNEIERKNVDYLLNLEKMIPSDGNIRFVEPLIFRDKRTEFKIENSDYSINSEEEITPDSNTQFTESPIIEKEVDSENKPFIPSAGIPIVFFAIISAIGLFALKHFIYRTKIKKK